MIPIINNSKELNVEFDKYKDIFSKPQFRHFSSYCTGLILQEKQFTINSINKLFVDEDNSRDQSSLNRFFKDSPWDEKALSIKRLRQLNSNAKTKTKESGYLILDDSCLPKTGFHMEAVGTHWSASENKTVFGHNMVSLHYIDEEKEYPLLPAFYRKKEHCKKDTFKTKIDIAMGLISDGVKGGLVKAKTCLFDAWYLSKKLVGHIVSLGLNWITRVSSKRNFLYNQDYNSIHSFITFDLQRSQLKTQTKISDDKSYYSYSFITTLSKIGTVKLVFVCDDPEDKTKDIICLSTNQTGLFDEQIIRRYLLRSRIDSFYRDAKQFLGLGGYMVRHVKGVVRHLHLVFFAYSLLETLRLKKNSVSWLKDKINTVAKLCQFVRNIFIRNLIKWSHSLFRRKVPIYKVLAMLNL